MWGMKGIWWVTLVYLDICAIDLLSSVLLWLWFLIGSVLFVAPFGLSKQFFFSFYVVKVLISNYFVLLLKTVLLGSLKSKHRKP